MLKIAELEKFFVIPCIRTLSGAAGSSSISLPLMSHRDACLLLLFFLLGMCSILFCLKPISGNANMENRLFFHELLSLNAVIIVMAGLYFSWISGLLLFHSFLDISSVSVVFFILTLFVNFKPAHEKKNKKFIISIYYTAVIFDLLGSLSLIDMMISQLNSHHKMLVFYLCARFFQTIVLLSAPLFLNPYRRSAVFSIIFFIWCSYLFYLLFGDGFPECLVQSYSPPDIRVISWYFFIIILLQSLFSFIINRSCFSVKHIPKISLEDSTDQSISISGFQDDDLEKNITSFRLTDVAGSISLIVEREAQRKNIGFTIEIDPEVPNKLFGDSIMLGQILMNICSNAVRFSHKGGCVSLKISNMGIKEMDKSVVLHFTISTERMGMSTEQARKLNNHDNYMESYSIYQLKDADLRLDISLRLVELIGGKIWLETEQGSRFAIIISTVLCVSMQNE